VKPEILGTSVVMNRVGPKSAPASAAGAWFAVTREFSAWPYETLKDTPPSLFE
jgi:hypothetical protein